MINFNEGWFKEGFVALTAIPGMFRVSIGMEF
jgi:hypothetical protein